MTEMAHRLDNARDRLRGTSDHDPLLDAHETAAMLKLSAHTVRELARDRAIPAIRLGRYWRFRRSALDAWIAEQERPAR